MLARKSVSDTFPPLRQYASSRVRTHPTTLAALAFPASPFADPAAAASFVSEMELVLLPSIALGGSASPRRLNSAVFKSGISGMACVPNQHHLLPNPPERVTHLDHQVHVRLEPLAFRRVSLYPPNSSARSVRFVLAYPSFLHIPRQQPVKPLERRGENGGRRLVQRQRHAGV